MNEHYRRSTVFDRLTAEKMLHGPTIKSAMAAPVRNPDLLEQVGYHVYYGGTGSYLYQPIPKNACTTIKTLLLRLEGLPVDENEWRRHQKEFNQFPGTSHLPLSEQIDIFEGRTQTFKFAVIRNPYSRAASAYANKVSKPEAYIIRKLKSSAAMQGVKLSEQITFDEFIQVISRQSLSEMDPHWRPQYFEGRFGAIKFDFIGRMENLSADLTYALGCIGAPSWLMQKVVERHNATNTSSDLWSTVSAEACRLFKSTYAIDFDTLHYSDKPPVSGVYHPLGVDR